MYDISNIINPLKKSCKTRSVLFLDTNQQFLHGGKIRRYYIQLQFDENNRKYVVAVITEIEVDDFSNLTAELKRCILLISCSLLSSSSLLFSFFYRICTAATNACTISFAGLSSLFVRIAIEEPSVCMFVFWVWRCFYRDPIGAKAERAGGINIHLDDLSSNDDSSHELHWKYHR